jgi:hypothetical protein
MHTSWFFFSFSRSGAYIFYKIRAGIRRSVQTDGPKCFIYISFKDMLQVFYMDAAKVDLDVAYVVMVIHVCCKYLFKMFHLLQTYVASVLSGYCICCSSYNIYCKHMFQMFIYFRRMLQQVFHVASVSWAGAGSGRRQFPHAQHGAGVGGPFVRMEAERVQTVPTCICTRNGPVQETKRRGSSLPMQANLTYTTTKNLLRSI